MKERTLIRKDQSYPLTLRSESVMSLLHKYEKILLYQICVGENQIKPITLSSIALKNDITDTLDGLVQVKIN